MIQPGYTANGVKIGRPPGGVANNRRDLTGMRFGRWTAIEYKWTINRGACWLFRCDCGGEKVLKSSNVICGKSRSCGCLKVDTWQAARTKHGKRYLPEYKIWLSMTDRCRNPRNKAFQNYGGRGITVCAEWQKNFEAFFAHIGPRPSPELSVDRINNDRGYEPGNVRWATPHEQRVNQRPKKRKARK